MSQLESLRKKAVKKSSQKKSASKKPSKKKFTKLASKKSVKKSAKKATKSPVKKKTVKKATRKKVKKTAKKATQRKVISKKVAKKTKATKKKTRKTFPKKAVKTSSSADRKIATPIVAVNPSQADRVPGTSSDMEYHDMENKNFRYEETYAGLICRDPNWVHAYWEVASEQFKEMRKKLGKAFDSSSYVLRFYEITGIEFDGTNAFNRHDVEVEPSSDHWYVNIWSKEAEYCFEFGLREASGAFHPLVRSNRVAMPRERLSSRREVVWMEALQSEGQGLFMRIKADDKKTPEADRQDKRFYLTEEETQLYLSGDFKNFNAQVTARLQEEFKEINELSDKAYALQKTTLRSPKSLEVNMASQSLALKAVGQTSSADQQSSAHLSSPNVGASEKNQATASSDHFYFEINTELIVYGRTEPGAQVTLGGRNVPINFDGTFSLRFALGDDSSIPLDFIARSERADQRRQITTSVKRSTTQYQS